MPINADQVIEALVKNGIDVKEKMQKMESSREDLEALLKRVLDLEKKLRERNLDSFFFVMGTKI